jgi:DHA2 family multidrug resistance protein-like MFS transporter
VTPDSGALRRGAIITACVVTGAGVVLAATSQYILDPMTQDFGLDSDQATLLKFIPGLATIVIVFVAGLLGDRVGPRRAISWGTWAMIAGGVLAGLSPTVLFAIIGMSLMSAGTSMMIVVALSLLSSAASDPTDRAKAFGTLGLVSPLVYLVTPLLAGAIVTYGSWRYVVLLWLIAGVAALVTTLRLVPRASGNREAGEMITPILAGIALVFITQVFDAISSEGLLSTDTLIRAALAAAAVLALWLVHRALKNPSLSFGPIRRRRSLMLLVATVIIPLASMWYTTFLLFEYLFGLTALQISLIMLPAQVLGMAGAKVASRIIINLGLGRAGLLAFLALAAIEASFLLVGVDGMVLTAVLMALFSFVTALVTVVMSNAVMDSAPPSESGTMASYRTASSRIGSSVASLVIGTVVLATYQSSLDAQSIAAGLDTTQTDAIAQQLTDADGSGDEASPPPPDSTEVEEVSEIQQNAMIDALYAKALFGVAMALGAGFVFTLGMRGRRLEDEYAQESATAGSPDES